MAKNDNESWMDNYNMQNNMNMDLLKFKYTYLC